MDRSWMNASRITEDYENGVEEFLQFAQTNAQPMWGKYFCPCVKCANGKCQIVNDITTHLICDGIVRTYTKWIWHGESPDRPEMSQPELINAEIGNPIEEMIHDLGQEGFQQARFGWSDKSFTELLMLLKNILPVDNMLPKNHYEAKKILCPVGMEYQKIHACRNDCILYRDDFAKMHCCLVCEVSWYRLNDGDSSVHPIATNRRPAKVCWYLPIIPRFQRLFANAEEAKDLTWHADTRKSDGCVRHPADSLQWKKLIISFANLSGYSVKGHHACPICETNTSFRKLKHGKKVVHTRHRRFLKHYHPYRRLKKAFDGSQEHETAPNPLTSNEVYHRDSLEEQVTQGSFVPRGRDDILNTAIGRPDHGGRVRAAGSGVTITLYYGRASRTCSNSSISISQ
ncbi:uncharacterized protein LOC114375713 [Glycine soja]|uniref:uncharacterized protein LOC114375713 n=1 Tax=Glycine soja TaxID=3848 RepID=UPI00103BA35F|nr:uncharacterized protein LOC114375713 [Glycine soja]